jgi:hypothetical protein
MMWKRALVEDVPHENEDEDKLTKNQGKEQSKHAAAMDYLTLVLEDDAFY